MAMIKFAEVTVGSGGAASIEFTGIPQTGKDLLVVISARTNQAAISDNNLLWLNGSASDFTGRYLFTDFNGTLLSGTDGRQAGAYVGSSATANTFSNVQLYFSNYSSNTNKSWSVESTSENNATQAGMYIAARTWANTSAITTLGITPTGGTYQQHSTASLYIIS